jgi:tryptophan-rich sensory protein
MRSLVGFVLLVALVAGVGGCFPPDEWFRSLAKPAWYPSGWVFGPVWTVLYLAIAVAGWRLWVADGGSQAAVPDPDASGEVASDPRITRRIALILWAAQLVLNGLWTPLFFGLHQPLWALVDILTLLAVLAASPGWFRHLSPLAAWLWVPYLLWVGFATALNAALVIGNPSL